MKFLWFFVNFLLLYARTASGNVLDEMRTANLIDPTNVNPSKIQDSKLLSMPGSHAADAENPRKSPVKSSDENDKEETLDIIFHPRGELVSKENVVSTPSFPSSTRFETTDSLDEPINDSKAGADLKTRQRLKLNGKETTTAEDFHVTKASNYPYGTLGPTEGEDDSFGVRGLTKSQSLNLTQTNEEIETSSTHYDSDHEVPHYDSEHDTPNYDSGHEILPHYDSGREGPEFEDDSNVTGNKYRQDEPTTEIDEEMTTGKAMTTEESNITGNKFQDHLPTTELEETTRREVTPTENSLHGNKFKYTDRNVPTTEADETTKKGTVPPESSKRGNKYKYNDGNQTTELDETTRVEIPPTESSVRGNKYSQRPGSRKGNVTSQTPNRQRGKNSQAPILDENVMSRPGSQSVQQAITDLRSKFNNPPELKDDVKLANKAKQPSKGLNFSNTTASSNLVTVRAEMSSNTSLDGGKGDFEPEVSKEPDSKEASGKGADLTKSKSDQNRVGNKSKEQTVAPTAKGSSSPGNGSKSSAALPSLSGNNTSAPKENQGLEMRPTNVNRQVTGMEYIDDPSTNRTLKSKLIRFSKNSSLPDVVNYDEDMVTDPIEESNLTGNKYEQDATEPTTKPTTTTTTTTTTTVKTWTPPDDLLLVSKAQSSTTKRPEAKKEDVDAEQAKKEKAEKAEAIKSWNRKNQENRDFDIEDDPAKESPSKGASSREEEAKKEEARKEEANKKAAMRMWQKNRINKDFEDDDLDSSKPTPARKDEELDTTKKSTSSSPRAQGDSGKDKGAVQSWMWQKNKESDRDFDREEDSDSSRTPTSRGNEEFRDNGIGATERTTGRTKTTNLKDEEYADGNGNKVSPGSLPERTKPDKQEGEVKDQMDENEENSVANGGESANPAYDTQDDADLPPPAMPERIKTEDPDKEEYSEGILERNDENSVVEEETTTVRAPPPAPPVQSDAKPTARPLKQMMAQTRVPIVSKDRPEAVDISELPYLAISVTRLNRTKEKNLRCTGAIISDLHILSAAHCYMDGGEVIDPSRVTIVTAQTGPDIYQLDAHAQMRTAEEISIYPGYSHGEGKEEEMVTNDLAVVKVLKPFVFNDLCQPVSFRISPLPEKEPITCMAPGWTYVDAASHTFLDSGRHLARMKLTVGLGSTCPCLHWLHPEGLICSMQDTAYSLCDEDMGGPLICGGKLVGLAHGLTSTNCSDVRPMNDSPRCTGGQKLTVYVYLCPYLGWLSGYVAELRDLDDLPCGDNLEELEERLNASAQTAQLAASTLLLWAFFIFK